MSIRYATIITDDDGREVVSAIGAFEGAAPQPRAGRFEQVVSGVLIGMVRGGPVDAVGGFGFPQGSLGVNGRAVGLARAELKARPDAGTAKCQTAKRASKAVPGKAVPGKAAPGNAATPADAAEPARKAARAKPARTRSGKAKAAKARPARPARGTTTAKLAGAPGRAEPAGVLAHG